jgi:uncharacterized protein YegP (UPF0339 family)
VYLNPDGRIVAFYTKKAKGKTDWRWSVYARNGKLTHASTEGFRNHAYCLKNASAPTAVPPVPELGAGIYMVV